MKPAHLGSRKRFIAVMSTTLVVITPKANAAWRFADRDGAGPDQHADARQGPKPGPLGRILATAHRYGSECSGLNEGKLAALMLAPTWAETMQSAQGRTPHPMTLSRGDTLSVKKIDNHRLYWDPNGDGDVNDNHRIYWHPGLGMWQLDDTSDYGRRLASGRFRPYYSMAHLLADKWCTQPKSPFGYIYQDWPDSCGDNGQTCRGTFEQIYDSVHQTLNIPDALEQNLNVDYWGGIKPRTCEFERDENKLNSSHSAPTTNCYYVDALGSGTDVDADGEWIHDGNDNFQGGANGTSPSPLARPFYIMYREPNGAPAREVRVWLEEDMDGAIDVDYGVSGERNIGTGARETLKYFTQTTLCDTTQGRGDC